MSAEERNRMYLEHIREAKEGVKTRLRMDKESSDDLSGVDGCFVFFDILPVEIRNMIV